MIYKGIAGSHISSGKVAESQHCNGETVKNIAPFIHYGVQNENARNISDKKRWEKNPASSFLLSFPLFFTNPFHFPDRAFHVSKEALRRNCMQFRNLVRRVLGLGEIGNSSVGSSFFLSSVSFLPSSPSSSFLLFWPCSKWAKLFEKRKTKKKNQLRRIGVSVWAGGASGLGVHKHTDTATDDHPNHLPQMCCCYRAATGTVVRMEREI